MKTRFILLDPYIKRHPVPAIPRIIDKKSEVIEAQASSVPEKSGTD